jgi:hypothetical protein
MRVIRRSNINTDTPEQKYLCKPFADSCNAQPWQLLLVQAETYVGWHIRL